MGINRSYFLLSLGSAGILAACGGGGTTPAAGGGPHGTPTPSSSTPPSFSNGTIAIDLTKTDLPAGTPVYVYVVGNIGSTYYWYSPAGTVQQMQLVDNLYSSSKYPASMSTLNKYQSELALNYNTPTGWADYAIPLTVGSWSGIDLTKILAIPGLGTGTSAFSGRIFFSVGPAKIPITPTATSGSTVDGYTAPTTLQGPGMYCLYDWCEFSIDSTGGLYINTTQVDQFGFPLIVGVSNGASPSPVGVLTAKREDAITQIAAAMQSEFGTNTMTLGGAGAYTTSVYAMSVPTFVPAGLLYPTGVNHLRAVAPKDFCTAISGYTPTAAVTTYFDTYISQCYTSWQTTPLLTYDQTYKQYSGFVPTSGTQAGNLVFYPGQLTIAAMQALYSGSTAPTYVLAIGAQTVISTNDVWGGSGTLAMGSAEEKNIGKMICAAFNRGTMSFSLDDTAVSISGAYGTGAVPTAPPSGGAIASSVVWNKWSQLWHQINADGLAYGFAYDDVNDQSTTIKVAGWASSATATIALGSFFGAPVTTI